MAKICSDVAGMLRKRFNGVPGVTVELEDSCDPAAEAKKALGGWGVLILVAASGHVRSRGSGALTVGEASIELTVIENPKRNRKSATPGPTVSVASEAARDALHWQFAEAYLLDYIDTRRADVAEDDFRAVVRFAARPFTPQLPPPAEGDQPEPEEVVEGRMVAMAMAAMPGWKVIGALAPAPEGEKRTMPGTCIAVSADVASQNLDWRGPGVPCAYTVRVEVRCADADDRTGGRFRAACRQIRAALSSLLGDGCSALGGDGFACDSFVLGGTETPLGDGDPAARRKAYTATVNGRFIPKTANKEEP